MKTIKLIPLKIKIVIILCYVIPLLLDKPNGFMEAIWALLVIPAVVCAYYFGLLGGIVAAIIIVFSQGLNEWFEYLNDISTYNFSNINVYIAVTITIVIATIGTGLLSDKMKRLILALEMQTEELKQSFTKLKMVESQLKSIIEFLPDATLVVDKDLKLIAWNKMVEEMTRVPKLELLGKGNYAYTVPFYGEARPHLIDLVFHDNPELAEKYSGLIKKGDILCGEAFVPCVYGGKGAYVWATASAMLDDDGNIVGAIECIRDITEKKQLENELRESEQRYRSLVELSPFPVIVQRNGTVLYANPSALKFSNKVDVGLGKSVFDYIEEDSIATVNTRIDQAVKEGPQYGELKVKDKEGELIELQSVTIAIPYEGDLAIMVVFHDITEMKQAQQAVKKYNEVLIREMKMAAIVQQNMLPSELPNISGFNFAWEFKPSAFISGDMFNVLKLSENQIGFYILDVMGHGLAAALQAVTISYTLKPSYSKSVLISDDLLKPSRTLEQLNNTYIQHSVSGDFFTIFYGVINTRTLEVTYARAGHPAPIVLSAEGEIVELNEGGLPIGLFVNSVYEDYKYQLKYGDKLVLYTDGIENQNNGFSLKEKLMELLSTEGNLEIAKLLKSIIDSSTRVEADIEEDDIALLGIEIGQTLESLIKQD